MNRKNLFLFAFVLVAVAQLFIPIQMISRQADFALAGTEYKFRIRHNPADGFRRVNTGSSLQGKYIWVQFDQDRYKVENKKEWNWRQTIWVSFISDSLGYARIYSVQKTRPVSGDEWVKAVAFLDKKDSSFLHLNYPFNHYYIEDKATQDIDSALTMRMNDTTSTICLNVRIRQNEFIVTDLVVDSLSFKDFVKKIRGKKSN